MIWTAEFAREKKIPFLGICFGMQLAVIEAARHAGDMPKAASSEFGASDQAVGGRLVAARGE